MAAPLFPHLSPTLISPFSLGLGFLVFLERGKKSENLWFYAVIWSGKGGPNPTCVLWDSSNEAVIFVLCVLQFSPIFVLGYDLFFPEFE
jgi:hypothetical protein